VRNRFQIKSFVIAAIFLAAYLNVFVTQASCNLSHLFEQTATKSSHHHDGGHDHHHGNEEVPPNHHDDKPDHHHDGKSGKKDNNCCNDKTSAFFASQGNPATSSVDFKNTYTECALINAILFVCNRPVFNTKGYVSYSLPPPKIPDIRVFIQSFII
jgi:hypothetical protein